MHMQATRQALSEDRWHFQHGPIDIVLQAVGEPKACQQAVESAWRRFQTVLPELVSELPLLRSPVSQMQNHSLSGEVAQRMWRVSKGLSWAAAEGFVTPMAAVAGSVAEELIALLAQNGVQKAYVNNGGDIALHLQENQHWRIGVVSDLQKALQVDIAMDLISDGQFVMDHSMPVRGVATSGWRGRSFSLGIADSVTVLAATAAQADVAATLISNAVNLDHPAIVRRPANSLRDDTDLGDRMVTIDVPALPPAQTQRALQLGLDCALAMQARGQIFAAFLCCQGLVAVAQPLECLV
jgi:ApbE superfamily uncharacterized protein (UPF0280 family)